MTPTKTERPEGRTEVLRKLLAEATPAKWSDDGEGFIYAPDSNPIAEIRGFGAGFPQQANCDLICFLRNNAALLLELVEAVEKVGHPGFCRRNATDEQCDECDLQDAIRKWNGGE